MWKAFLSSVTLQAPEIYTKVMIKHSHTPVFLNNMNESRNTTNVSKLGMPSPFAVIFFDKAPCYTFV
jgi:hypothetical protein